MSGLGTSVLKRKALTQTSVGSSRAELEVSAVRLTLGGGALYMSAGRASDATEPAPRAGEGADLGSYGAVGVESDEEAFLAVFGVSGQCAVGEAGGGGCVDDLDHPDGRIDPPRADENRRAEHDPRADPRAEHAMDDRCAGRTR